MKIISENTLALVNHARPKTNQSTKKMFPSFNFDKSDNIRLCDLLNIGRRHRNILPKRDLGSVKSWTTDVLVLLVLLASETKS